MRWLLVLLLIVRFMPASAQHTESDTCVNYFKIPYGFVQYMDGRTAMWEGARFKFDADARQVLLVTEYYVGVQYRQIFKPAFDSLYAAQLIPLIPHWTDSTVYCLTRSQLE